MGKKNEGLYHKFDISRTDGQSESGQKHESCDYFVLDLTHDPYALPAIKAYKEACEKEYYPLSRDLARKIAKLEINYLERWK